MAGLVWRYDEGSVPKIPTCYNLDEGTKKAKKVMERFDVDGVNEPAANDGPERVEVCVCLGTQKS